MIQGREFGYFRAGRYLRWGSYDPLTTFSEDTGGERMNRLNVSLCHSMGLPEIDVVGDAAWGEGPIEELV
jgi:hypothetical protein